LVPQPAAEKAKLKYEMVRWCVGALANTVGTVLSVHGEVVQDGDFFTHAPQGMTRVLDFKLLGLKRAGS